jgi:hypothetical protein
MRRPVALVGILVLLAGCRPPSPAPVVTMPDDLPARRDVTVHHLSLAKGFYTVDVLVPNAFPPPRPAVVSLLGEEDAMLDAGLAVVKYAIHWELLRGAGKPSRPTGAEAERPSPPRTFGKWLLASPSPRTIGQGYFQLIAGNAEGTIPRVIDAVVTLPDVDARRLGIAGVSTNGFAVLQALAVEPRLTAGVAIAACGDYHRFLQASPLAMDGGPLDLDPEYESWLHTKEPIRQPERLVHAALLMVNGDQDRTVPLSCVRETVRVFRRAYRKAHASRRFRFVLLEGEGHNAAGLARRETLDWWGRWLLHPPGVAPVGRVLSARASTRPRRDRSGPTTFDLEDPASWRG